MLEQECIELEAKLASERSSEPVSLEKLCSVIDLTLLNLDADSSLLAAFETRLTQYPFAAACVYPQHLNTIQIPSAMKRAVVVNFPDGNQSVDRVRSAIEDALVIHGANEIDFVFPYQSYLNGQSEKALDTCRQAFQQCEQHKALFKVILETGVFKSSSMIFQAALEILDQGCHFLKTSTGKIATGATPLSAFILLKALKSGGYHHCGLKVSGGIKTVEQASYYWQLAEIYMNKQVDKSWFRIGTSRLQDHPA